MVSAQVAQCAASRNLNALLNPNPPAASGTGRHCIGSDPQQPAEAMPDLIIVAPGEQLRADGADVEIGPR